MKHKVLARLGILGFTLLAGISLAGCSSKNSQENKAKVDLMQYMNGQGKSMVTRNTFNRDTNTDNITFTPTAVNHLNLENEINSGAQSKNKKTQQKAKQLLNSHKILIKETSMNNNSLRQAIRRSYTDSKDKGLKIHVTNQQSTYPQVKIEQAQLQPTKQAEKQAMSKIRNNMIKSQKQSQQKQKQQMLTKYDKTMNQRRGKLQKEMNSKHVPKSEQKQAIDKFNNNVKQQRNKISKKIDGEIAQVNKKEHIN